MENKTLDLINVNLKLQLVSFFKNIHTNRNRVREMVKITMINSKKRNSSHAKTQLQETKTLIIHGIGACGVVGHYEE